MSLSAAISDIFDHYKLSSRSRSIVAAALFCAISAVAHSASADAITVKYYGTLDTGEDQTGVFGSVGSLAGDNFVATFQFNVNSPNTSALTSAASDQFHPASSFFYTSNIEINGVTHTVSGTYRSTIQSFSTPSGSPYNYSFFDVDSETFTVTQLAWKFFGIFSVFQESNSDIKINAVDSASVLPGTLDRNFSGALGSASGQFSIADYDYVSNDVPNDRINIQNDAFGHLVATYLTVSVNGAEVPGPPGPVVDVVPEPASWALMIMGFGAAGAALRRRVPSAIRTH